MSDNYTSRFPEIVAELAVKLDAVGQLTAETVVVGAKANLALGPPKVHLKEDDHIHVEHVGVGEHMVVAGDNETFYGHIVEHGSVHAAAHPFLMPAAEATVPEIDRVAKIALRDL